jgi:hypothetical protein
MSYNIKDKGAFPVVSVLLPGRPPVEAQDDQATKRLSDEINDV